MPKKSQATLTQENSLEALKYCISALDLTNAGEVSERNSMIRRLSGKLLSLRNSHDLLGDPNGIRGELGRSLSDNSVQGILDALNATLDILSTLGHDVKKPKKMVQGALFEAKQLSPQIISASEMLMNAWYAGMSILDDTGNPTWIGKESFEQAVKNLHAISHDLIFLRTQTLIGLISRSTTILSDHGIITTNYNEMQCAVDDILGYIAKNRENIA